MFIMKRMDEEKFKIKKPAKNLDNFTHSIRQFYRVDP